LDGRYCSRWILGPAPIPREHDCSPYRNSWPSFFSSLVSRFLNDWSADIATYSRDVELAQCIFRVKQVRLPHLTTHQGPWAIYC
jgi:hypothetical protein